MYKTVFILSCVFAACQAIYWKDCGSKQGVVKSVTVAGCPTTRDKTPCQLKRGSNATFEVVFDSNEAAGKLHSIVHGIVAGVPLPFPLPNPDGCKDRGLTCPLKPNADLTFTQSIEVKSTYPAIKLIVKWELQDGNSDDVFCINVSAQVVS